MRPSCAGNASQPARCVRVSPVSEGARCVPLSRFRRREAAAASVSPEAPWLRLDRAAAAAARGRWTNPRSSRRNSSSESCMSHACWNGADGEVGGAAEAAAEVGAGCWVADPAAGVRAVARCPPCGAYVRAFRARANGAASSYLGAACVPSHPYPDLAHTTYRSGAACDHHQRCWERTGRCSSRQRGRVRHPLTPPRCGTC